MGGVIYLKEQSQLLVLNINMRNNIFDSNMAYS